MLQSLNPALVEPSLQGEQASRDAKKQGRSGNLTLDRETGKMVLRDDDAMGGTGNLYWWGQNDNEVTVKVGKLPLGVRTRDIQLKLTPSTLKLVVLGITVLDGELCEKIKAEESTFELEDHHGGRLVVVTLAKLKKTTGSDHWRCVVVGEPEIDVQEFGPKVADIDLADPASLQQFEDMKKEVMLKNARATPRKCADERRSLLSP